MAKEKSDNEKILAALVDLRRRVEELFILQATIAGVGQREVRAMLGIDLSRVTKVAKHAKKEGKQSGRASERSG
jgi:DNA-directed RNA polymerase specialized sigma24 family protein